MAAHVAQPTRSQRFIKVYLAAWGLLAAGAPGYLAVLAWQPQHLTQRPQTGEPDSGIRAIIKGAVADATGSVRRAIQELRSDLGQLKDAVGERENQEKVLRTRVTALEDKVATIDAAQTAAAAPVPKSKAADKAQRKAEAPAPVRAITPASEPPAPAARAEGPPVALETGSIAAPAQIIPFGEAVVTPASQGVFAVQLAAGPSLPEIKRAWGQLVQGHGPALAQLEPRVVTPRAEGSNYRLLAGPLPSKADADRVCQQLGVGRAGCFSTMFIGDPL